MKKYNTVFLALLLVGALAASSCDKEKGDDSSAAVSNISFTPCGNHTDALAKADPIWGDPDSVSIRYANGTVFITHYNLEVNCGFEQDGVAVDIAVDGSTITISEHEVGYPLADCMCTTDNSFRIDNIPSGTYTLVFTNWSPSPHSVTCSF